MDHTIALIRKSHEGDKEARERLVEENVGLVWCVVRRFQGRGTEAEDLFQIGSIGLLKAIDKFDLSYDVKFSTYAVPMISGEIRRFLRDDGMLKVSRSLKELSYKTMRAEEKLTAGLGREPTLAELAAELGVGKEELAEAMEGIEEEDRGEETVIARMLLEQLLGTLTADERRLIWLRYFDGKTQSEAGKILGISQVQVSRTEKRIMAELRKRGDG